MVTRTATSEGEPEQMSFALPSEDRKHLFQITESWDIDNPHKKLNTDENTVIVKLEVVDGDEAERTMLHWVNLDDKWTGFFRTKLFLKSIGEPYNGVDFPIISDNWQARRFYATVTHTDDGKYANIDQFFEDESKALNEGSQKNDSISWE